MLVKAIIILALIVSSSVQKPVCHEPPGSEDWYYIDHEGFIGEEAYDRSHGEIHWPIFDDDDSAVKPRKEAKARRWR